MLTVKLLLLKARHLGLERCKRFIILHISFTENCNCSDQNVLSGEDISIADWVPLIGTHGIGVTVSITDLPLTLLLKE